MLAGGNLAIAEKIERLDRAQYGNRERTNRLLDGGKRDAVIQNERKIALDSGKARQRLIAKRGARFRDGFEKRLEQQFSQINILAEFEFVRHVARKLAGNTEWCLTVRGKRNSRGAIRREPLRAAALPVCSSGERGNFVEITFQIGEGKFARWQVN